MKIKNLIKKKSFWVSLSALIVIVAQTCGLTINAPYVNEIINGVCAILVLAGVLTSSEKTEITEALENNAGSELISQVNLLIEKAKENNNEVKISKCLELIKCLIEAEDNSETVKDNDLENSGTR